MIPEQELRDYAAVVLEVGLGFQPGKDLAINAWIEHAPFASILADEAYKRGAELLKFCQDALQEAAQQVKVLENGVLKSFSATEQ